MATRIRNEAMAVRGRAGRFPALLAETLAATAASALTLTLMARLRVRGGLQPLNATSHWLNGEAAADDTRFGWRTTGFWAAIYEFWLRRGRPTRADILGKAAAMAGVSALIDYRATPKRFTPGWESVLTPRDMALAYLALAAGLAVGAAQGRPQAAPR